LSPKGLLLLQRLVVDEQRVEVASAELGMTIDAVYAWKGRLARRLRALISEVSTERVSESDEQRPTPLQRASR
ncbi:MAG: hypothetical protein ACHREM_10255, partial [Polyangiales bacterium]